MKFLKQLEQQNCGPIAMLNMLKWLGHKVTRVKDLIPISDRMGTQIYNGTDLPYMLSYMTDHVYVKVNENPKLLEMTESFVILYTTNKRTKDTHYVFGFRKNGAFWTLTNYKNVDGTYEHVDMNHHQLKKILNKDGTHVFMIKE